MSEKDVKQLLTIIERLPEDKVTEVLDFAQFLVWQETARSQAKRPIEIWAEALAQEKGFANLTEDDVAKIVHETRNRTS